MRVKLSLLTAILCFGSMVFIGGCTKSETNSNPSEKTQKLEEQTSATIKATTKGSEKDATNEKKLELKDIKLLTEEYPPLNFTDTKTGEVKGRSTDTIQKAFAKLGVEKLDIQVLPWSRALQIMETSPDTLLYSIARTEEREKKYQWIGPISSIRTYFYALKSKAIKLEKLEEAKKYKIAVVQKDYTEESLKKKGFTDNLETAINQNLCVKMVANARADLWIGTADKEDFAKICKESGEDANNFEQVLDIDKFRTDVYIAANLKIPSELIKQIQDALPKVE